MKKLSMLLLAVFTAGILRVYAQEESKPTYYALHEDLVIPSKNAEYNDASKKLVEALKQHNIEMNFTALWHDDNSVIFVSEIENFAALDNNPFANLAEKLGEEKMQAIWDNFDGTYYSHKDFVVAFHEDLSYMPNGEPQEGVNFREVFFWSIIPGKEDEARELALEWKKLYESKNVPTGYGTYTTVMGEEMPTYVFVSWGKDPAEIASNGKKIQELLGDEGNSLWQKSLKITRKMNMKYANVVQDLSYNYSASQEESSGN